MKAICVDDNNIILSSMLSYIKELSPRLEVAGFDNSDEAITFAEDAGCDVLFTEIELGGKPVGLELARKLQSINPHVNIIFATVCSEREYAEEVMQIRPSAYLKKVVTKKDLKKALGNLLYT